MPHPRLRWKVHGGVMMYVKTPLQSNPRRGKPPKENGNMLFGSLPFAPNVLARAAPLVVWSDNHLAAAVRVHVVYKEPHGSAVVFLHEIKAKGVVMARLRRTLGKRTSFKL
jgi:hypothetical protein